MDLLLTCCGHNYRIEETGPEDLQTEIQSPEDTKSHAVSVPNQAEVTADSQRSRLENMLHNSDHDAKSDEDAAQNSQMEEEQVRIRSLIMPELLHNSEDDVFSDDETNNTGEPSQDTEVVNQAQVVDLEVNESPRAQLILTNSTIGSAEVDRQSVIVQPDLQITVDGGHRMVTNRGIQEPPVKKKKGRGNSNLAESENQQPPRKKEKKKTRGRSGRSKKNYK